MRPSVISVTRVARLPRQIACLIGRQHRDASMSSTLVAAYVSLYYATTYY